MVEERRTEGVRVSPRFEDDKTGHNKVGGDGERVFLRTGTFQVHDETDKPSADGDLAARSGRNHAHTIYL